MAFDWHTATDAEVDYEYSPSLHALRPWLNTSMNTIG
jgi:hypothetical protein